MILVVQVVALNSQLEVPVADEPPLVVPAARCLRREGGQADDRQGGLSAAAGDRSRRPAGERSSEVRDGMAKVNEQIESKFSAWLAFRHHTFAGEDIHSDLSSCQVNEKVDA